MTPIDIKYRSILNDSDVLAIREILNSTGYFYDYEVEIAEELAGENLLKGEQKSGYIFNIAEMYGNPIAFSCYGKTPCTADSFDLYWIAVHESQRGKGIGKKLMDMAVSDIGRLSGKNIWIETSSRPVYESTRLFYLKYGCEIIAELPNFYGKNDNKVVFLKRV